MPAPICESRAWKPRITGRNGRHMLAISGKRLCGGYCYAVMGLVDTPPVCPPPCLDQCRTEEHFTLRAAEHLEQPQLIRWDRIGRMFASCPQSKLTAGISSFNAATARC